MRIVYIVMASVNNVGLNYEESKVDNEKKAPSTGMSGETSPGPLNKIQSRESYWFAHGGLEDSFKNAQSKLPADPKDLQSQKDKEERIRIFREQQEEERLKRLKDLEQQFLQSKKHREQQEEERKRKIEEARVREVERRQQVEERKRQIWEAEQERKEAILRRNMEREARIEARRNAQRNSQCFAFGSSTPRSFDLDLAAIGVGRSAGQGSVLMSSVSSRKSEERELGPPRATSACSLDRKFGDDCMSRSMVSLSSSAFRGRKRTDITPTLTRERSITPHVTPRGKDTSRSPSRPQSSMSGASEVSLPSSSVSAVNMRPRPAPRKPRPYSVAVDHLVSSSLATEKKSLERQPRVAERTAPTNDLHQRAKSVGREKGEWGNAKPLVAAKKPVPPPKSSQVLARAKSHPVPLKDNLRKPVKPGFEPSSTISSKVKRQNEKQSTKESETNANNLDVESKLDPASTEAVKGSPLTSPVTDSEMCISSDDSKISAVTESETNTGTRSFSQSESKVEEQPQAVIPDVIKTSIVNSDSKDQVIQEEKSETDVLKVSVSEKTSSEVVAKETQQNEALDTESNLQNDAFSTKPRITSEEEARAALAEKRRLAREQAEREAELERQRQEEIKRKEEEQKRLEELEQKRMEEEQIRLAELHRKLEEEKLRKAIEEQQQREREEQERREEEARQKLEKEEQERKAREEAEKQRIELEERLRKEEEERAERKRRVEQIMARTRGKGSAAQSPSSPQVENNTMKVNSESLIENVKNSVSTNSLSNGGSHAKVEQNMLFSSATGIISENSNSVVDEKKILNNHLPDLLNSEIIANHSNQKNGLHSESDKLFSSNSVSNYASNRTLSANDAAFSNQTNGYINHEDMSCTTSPEDVSSSGLLISIENSQQSSKIQSESTEFSKLVDLESSLNNINNDNYLINVDNVNSNLLTSESSYLTFDETLQKKQDSSITDLLS